MSRKIRASITKTSVWHLVMAAFALFAVLPLLMLVQLGTLNGGGSATVVHDRTQLALYLFFLAGCHATGLLLLYALAQQIRKAKTVGVQVAHESLPAIASLLGLGGAAAPSLQPHPPENELEFLSDTLKKFQDDIALLIQRVQPHSSMLREVKLLLEHLDEMVLIVDQTGQVSFSNLAARTVLGIVPERPVRQALAESCITGSGQDALARLLLGINQSTERISLATAAGTHLQIGPVLKEFSGEHGGPLRMVVLRDVTNISRLERQLYRTEKLASLGQLISGVAHELNNPLAAVLGFAELCRNSSQSREELDGNLEIIEREARRTARIVENLLNFSRSRSACRSLCNIHDLIERCFVLLHYQFKTNSIKVSRNYSAAIPPLHVDEFQVQQVLMNLLANSCQALAHAKPSSDPMLHVATRLDADSGRVLVEIADNGPGIPPDLREHVFEPFFTTKGEDHGTGLGLPISLAIMEEHAGWLRLVPPPENFSTCFAVEFPVPPRDLEPCFECSPDRAPACHGTVLLVEDEEPVLMVSRAALEQIGLTVETATDLKGAKTALVNGEYDLILIDYYMPDGDAGDFLSFVARAMPSMRDRIIVASGDPAIASRLAQNCGTPCPPILAKPFRLIDLQNMARNQLGRLPAGKIS